jgi:hypothetical protein
MNLIVVTSPSVEPVTLAQVYDHLRLTPTDSPPTHPHDDLLTRHIASARGDAERITKRAFVQQTLRLYAPGFPFNAGQQYYGVVQGSSGFYGQQTAGRTRNLRNGAIELLRPPLVSVESVKYYDEDNVLQTVTASDYYTTNDLVPQLRFIDGYAPPYVYSRPDAFQVNYIAGYPAADSPPTDYTTNIPAEIKNAILLGVELLYNPLKPDEREALERARDALLSGFTITTL